jgi:hypothetical protein
MTTPWSDGKIFWTPTVPQPFDAPVVDGHATVPEGSSTTSAGNLEGDRYY